MGQPCGWNRKEEETRLDQFGCTNATSVAVLTPFMPICLLSSLLHSLVDTQTPARQTTWCTGQANLAELVGWRCCLAAWAAGGFHQEMIFFPPSNWRFSQPLSYSLLQVRSKGVFGTTGCFTSTLDLNNMAVLGQMLLGHLTSFAGCGS